MRGRPPDPSPLVLAAALALALAGCPAKERQEPCPSGQTSCFGTCMDLQTGDGGYCGTCGLSCQGLGVSGLDATCTAGTCVCAGTATAKDCGTNPRCVNTLVDASNCGTCGNTCDVAKHWTCDAGTCKCAGSYGTQCGTACVNVLTDVSNCGTCGHACTLAREECSSGTCGCPSTFPTACPTASPTACVNTSSDPLHCGSCTNVCKTGATCSSGTCQCLAPRPDDCNTFCADLSSDPKHCGSCTNACATGAACSGSTCICPSGPSVGCGGACCAGGAACCTGGGCPIEHSNGLGQSYFDCNPLYLPGSATTLAAAWAAADAWSTGTTYADVPCGPYTLARQTESQCAVWAYGASPVAGRVALDSGSSVCLCPGQGSPSWN